MPTLSKNSLKKCLNPALYFLLYLAAFSIHMPMVFRIEGPPSEPLSFGTEEQDLNLRYAQWAFDKKIKTPWSGPTDSQWNAPQGIILNKDMSVFTEWFLGKIGGKLTQAFPSLSKEQSIYFVFVSWFSFALPLFFFLATIFFQNKIHAAIAACLYFFLPAQLFLNFSHGFFATPIFLLLLISVFKCLKSFNKTSLAPLGICVALLVWMLESVSLLLFPLLLFIFIVFRKDLAKRRALLFTLGGAYLLSSLLIPAHIFRFTNFYFLKYIFYSAFYMFRSHDGLWLKTGLLYDVSGTSFISMRHTWLQFREFLALPFLFGGIHLSSLWKTDKKIFKKIVKSPEKFPHLIFLALFLALALDFSFLAPLTQPILALGFVYFLQKTEFKHYLLKKKKMTLKSWAAFQVICYSWAVFSALSFTNMKIFSLRLQTPEPTSFSLMTKGWFNQLTAYLKKELPENVAIFTRPELSFALAKHLPHSFHNYPLIFALNFNHQEAFTELNTGIFADPEKFAGFLKQKNIQVYLHDSDHLSDFIGSWRYLAQKGGFISPKETIVKLHLFPNSQKDLIHVWNNSSFRVYASPSLFLPIHPRAYSTLFDPHYFSWSTTNFLYKTGYVLTDAIVCEYEFEKLIHSTGRKPNFADDYLLRTCHGRFRLLNAMNHFFDAKDAKYNSLRKHYQEKLLEFQNL